jgi:hypothetical protein
MMQGDTVQFSNNPYTQQEISMTRKDGSEVTELGNGNN